MHIQKALTFRASSIGDSLMAKYLLENIRAEFPHARYGIVVGSRGSMIRDLLSAYPWIEVIEANRWSPRALFMLVKRFWRSDFVCTLYTGGLLNLSTKLMARFLARRDALIGFIDRSKVNKFLYDKLLYLKPDRSSVPRLLERDALRAADIPIAMEQMTFKYLPQPGLLARLGLQKNGYIVVGLFSGADARGLSPEKRQELVDALVRALPTMPLVFIGTEKEREQITLMRLPQNSKIVETSVQEVAALIDASACMVSLGTGTSHIASLLRKPLVVLVACQGLQWVGTDQYGDAPIQVFCRPEMCPHGHDYSGYGPCINAIDMNAVAKATAAHVTKVQEREF